VTNIRWDLDALHVYNYFVQFGPVLKVGAVSLAIARPHCRDSQQRLQQMQLRPLSACVARGHE
jgi:hypothetical protein